MFLHSFSWGYPCVPSAHWVSSRPSSSAFKHSFSEVQTEFHSPSLTFFFIFLCIFYTINGSHIIITIIATLNLISDIYIMESCSLLFPTIGLFSKTHVLHTAGFQECLPYQTHGSLDLVLGDSLGQAWDSVPALSDYKPSSKSIFRAKGPPDHPAAYVSFWWY